MLQEQGGKWDWFLFLGLGLVPAEKLIKEQEPQLKLVMLGRWHGRQMQISDTYVKLVVRVSHTYMAWTSIGMRKQG